MPVAYQGTAGFFINSYALIADAIESTTDIFASFLVLFELNTLVGQQIKPPIWTRSCRTFNYVYSGWFLITSATIIAYESILNIRIAHDSPKPWTLLVLGQ
jgi:divalent metal cation (Fe/Co/Zn/Cd) transporter